MKYRDSYRVEAKEKNDREEFSVELEDVFFDSVSDHCAEQNKNLSGKQVSSLCILFTFVSSRI